MFSPTWYILHICTFSDLDLPQIEQQNFQSRVNEIMSKKKQKLWEIQARVDSGKREVHCAKVWAKILDNSFAMFSFLLSKAIMQGKKSVDRDFLWRDFFCMLRKSFCMFCMAVWSKDLRGHPWPTLPQRSGPHGSGGQYWRLTNVTTKKRTWTWYIHINTV